MIKSIKAIFCINARRRIHISVKTRIVGGETVHIEGSVRCRHHELHGCDKVIECNHIQEEYVKWLRDGALL